MHALEVPRGRGGHLHPGAHRAGDRDELRGGVLDQHPTGLPIAEHDVENPRGEDLGGELGEAHRGLRRRLARLQHDGVARREGRTDLPHRHVQRVVPRRHLRDHTDRLAADVRRETLRVLRRRPPVEVTGCAREEAELVHRLHDLVGDEARAQLSGVLRLQIGELLRVRLQRISEAEQQQLALGGRRPLPRVEGAGCRRERGIHLRRRRDRSVAVDLAGHGAHERQSRTR